MVAKHKCRRCGTETSIFWWSFTVGFTSDGEPTHAFELCDLCILDFLKFMEGKE